ncbi:MAG TPA: hypothetical protein VF219_18155, partial [Vicinamibacterales bacterium]
IGVELWAVAACVQAVQNMFSGPPDRQSDYSSSTTTYRSSADLSDEERKRQRNQKVVEKCVEECTKAAVTGGE